MLLNLFPSRRETHEVDSIMTGHLNVPALEPDADAPATLSHNILTDILRNQLGFEGLVVTDAMDMGGITVGVLRAGQLRAVRRKRVYGAAGTGRGVRSVASRCEVRTNLETWTCDP